MEKEAKDLKFVRSKDPLPTIEVDLDSIPKNFDYDDIVAGALEEFAHKSPATFYVYYSQFGSTRESNNPVFLGVAGSVKLLSPILTAFKKIPGVRAKYSDSIPPLGGSCKFHIQDGHVWQPLDDETWYSTEKNTDSECNESETGEGTSSSREFVGTEKSEADTGRASNPSRFRIARADASIGSIRSAIEEVFGLPEGSVAICGRDGKHLRADTKIATLKKRWEN